MIAPLFFSVWSMFMLSCIVLYCASSSYVFLELYLHWISSLLVHAGCPNCQKVASYLSRWANIILPGQVFWRGDIKHLGVELHVVFNIRTNPKGKTKLFIDRNSSPLSPSEGFKEGSAQIHNGSAMRNRTGERLQGDEDAQGPSFRIAMVALCRPGCHWGQSAPTRMGWRNSVLDEAGRWRRDPTRSVSVGILTQALGSHGIMGISWGYVMSTSPVPLSSGFLRHRWPAGFHLKRCMVPPIISCEGVSMQTFLAILKSLEIVWMKLWVKQ